MSLMARKALAYDSYIDCPAYDAYITTPITTKSMFSVSKFCMKYEFGNTDTDTDTAVFCNTDTEYRTDFKKYRKNTEYRYRLKIPIPTQL